MLKSWFEERIGKTVIREYNDRETEFEVTEKNVGYLWLFTEKGYTFRESVVSKMETVAKNATVDNDAWLEAARPKIRLHATMNGDGTNSKMCIGACEG